MVVSNQSDDRRLHDEASAWQEVHRVPKAAEVRKTGGSHRKGVVTPGERESSREAVVGSSWHGMAWLRTWCGRKRSGGDGGGVAMGWE
eukprot:11650910-Ditylum_brightwellii.AAC.1